MKELKKKVDEGRVLYDFTRSDVGKLLFSKLKEEYIQLVMSATRESKYAPAIRAIENLVSYMGTSIDVGLAAQEQLERLKSKTPKEDW